MATCVACLRSVEVKNFLSSVVQIVCMVSFAYIHRYSRYYLSFFFRVLGLSHGISYSHKNMLMFPVNG